MKRSTEAALAPPAPFGAVGRFAIAVSLPIATTACPGSSPAVEVPMAADDGGARIAIVADAAPEPERRSSDMPFARGDVYHGFYYCTQGRTALVLTVDDADDEGLEAIFAFDFKGSSRTAATKGSFRMHGTWDAKTKHLDLKAERWIDEPDGWEMVDLAMTLQQKSGALNGTVGAPGCSTVQLTPDTPKNVR